jgi:hypothetical protein
VAEFIFSQLHYENCLEKVTAGCVGRRHKEGLDPNAADLIKSIKMHFKITVNKEIQNHTHMKIRK